jgi:hypothetical protein
MSRDRTPACDAEARDVTASWDIGRVAADIGEMWIRNAVCELRPVSCSLLLAFIHICHLVSVSMSVFPGEFCLYLTIAIVVCRSLK